MKKCSKCGREWPDTGKFCPMDGARLVDIEPAPAPKEDPQPKAKGVPAAAAPRVDGAARPGAARPARPARPASRQRPAPPGQAGAEGRMAKLQSAATVILDAEEIEKFRKQKEAEKAAGKVQEQPPPGAAPTSAPRRKPKRPKFSETQWFMQGVKAEQLEDVDIESDLDDVAEKYAKDDNIDQATRKKYSIADSFIDIDTTELDRLKKSRKED